MTGEFSTSAASIIALENSRLQTLNAGIAYPFTQACRMRAVGLWTRIFKTVGSGLRRQRLGENHMALPGFLGGRTIERLSHSGPFMNQFVDERGPHLQDGIGKS